MRSATVFLAFAAALPVSVASGEETTRLRSDPESTYVRELAPGVFFRKAQTQPVFTGCNQGWVEFRDYVLVIDANFPGQAVEVIELIQDRTDKPIRFIFDTHHHGDHADGNMQYTRLGAVALASERSRTMFDTKGEEGFLRSVQNRAEEYAGLTYTKPTVYFPRRLVLDDGEQRVELLYNGHAHTMGDAVAWLPEHGILFSGDMCVNGPFNYTGDADTASWINVLTELQQLPVETIAPGHGEPAGKELLALQKRYFEELRSTVQNMMDRGYTLEEIKRVIDLPFYEEWTGVPVRDRAENIERVYQELNEGRP